MNTTSLWAVVLAVSLSPHAVFSQTFVNGSLTGPNQTFSLIPPGWVTLFPGPDPTYNPDTEGEFGPHERYNLSPDGGTFVAGAHSTTQPPLGIEGIQQALAELSVGFQYRLDFYQSNLGFGTDNIGGAWSATANWQLYIDGDPTGLFSDAMVPETGPLPNNSWFASAITFSPTSATHSIAFGPHSVSGQDAFLGIDGIRITLVPEPATVALFGVALVGLSAASRCRVRRKVNVRAHRQ